MLEPIAIKQTALDYLLSNLGILPEYRQFFEVIGITCFENNEWMINISIVGLVGKYWNILSMATREIFHQTASLMQTIKTVMNPINIPIYLIL
ncbi:MAG: hypothetical protein AAFQ80_23660 [Cyanobacteria bacterium J06621_8]